MSENRSSVNQREGTVSNAGSMPAIVKDPAVADLLEALHRTVNADTSPTKGVRVVVATGLLRAMLSGAPEELARHLEAYAAPVARAAPPPTMAFAPRFPVAGSAMCIEPPLTLQ